MVSRAARDTDSKAEAPGGQPVARLGLALRRNRKLDNLPACLWEHAAQGDANE